jgi:LemA protein
MPIVLVVVVVLVVLVGLVAVVGLNRLRQQRVLVDEAAAGIDVQLTRRAELVPNLVETVKGYMGHERATLEAVTDARSAMGSARTMGEKAAADSQMQAALASLFAVAEAYPDLLASQNFQALQAELTRTEDQLAFARQYHNDSASTLNRTMVTIPWSLFVGMSGVHRAEFYDAPTQDEAPPQVDFGTSGAGGAR